MAYNDWSLPSKKLINAFPNLPSSATRFLPAAIGVLGFLGFLDATYLTLLHYKNVIPPCTIAHGCETVLTSQYATIAGIPIALIGAGFYLAVLVLVGLLLSNPSNLLRQKKSSLSERSESKGNNQTIISLLLALTGTGFAVGIFLVYLQAFVIHAFCQYCLGSEVIDFLLFDCAWWLWRKNT